MLVPPQSHFHADAQTAHAAVTRIEAVATGDQARPVFNRVHVRFMFNAALYPPTGEQDGKRIAALDILSVLRVVQGIVSAIGSRYKSITSCHLPCLLLPVLLIYPQRVAMSQEMCVTWLNLRALSAARLHR